MSKAQITIKDLANKLNISISTVSRALRDATDINPETKKAILALACELRYQPNYIAQSLVKQETKIIGIIMPTINSYYFSQALIGMTDIASEYGYYIMFCQSNETVLKEKKDLKKLIACHIDGLLISLSKETREKEEFEELLQNETQMVMFDRILTDVTCSKVIVDEYEGAFKAVEHLIKKGCKHIAHIAGPKDLSVSTNRMNGYLAALKKHKLPINNELIIRCNAFEDDVLKAIKKLLKVRPTPDGIFFINDLSAIIAIKYYQKIGIRIPEDIKVVGFNDDPSSIVIEPSLTTVMQPGYEVGKLSMGILIDEIQNKKTKFQTFKLRTKLIIRNSSK
jgi:DNA-binding LacI/PurR family transcriptional regulator